MSAVLWLIGFTATIWVVELVNAPLDHRLTSLGIVPRSIPGLIGIPLSPFIHGSFGHVVSNTIPLLVLGGIIAFQGRQKLLEVSVIIIALGGTGVWLLGRSSFHVGASGLVFGYFGYLVARGLYDRSAASILVAVAVFVLYGGLLFGVLPVLSFVSWEGHLFGLMAGVFAARLNRRR